MHFNTNFDPNKIEWHHIEEPADENGFKVDYEYSILAYDISFGRLDMMMRFNGNGGGCEPHSHLASTTLLILQGEQRLKELQADGSIKEIIRTKGDYALCPPDAAPHIESSGPQGCTLFLSLHAQNGGLFGVYDSLYNKLADFTIEDFVARWTAR